MSVQFGRWNLDGKPLDPDYLENLKLVIAPYGPDGGSSYTKADIGILYRPFHTTKESRRETQPHVSESGAILTWDGRLDNRAELIHRLTDVLTIDSTDASIVAAAYQQWGRDCFAAFVGDWALSIWDPQIRALILAKDTIGTRHLYYSITDRQVTWCTLLDPFILFANKSFSLCEEYIAGWFSSFPAAHLTPYVGIHSVPPSSSVVIQNGKQTVTKYWDFDPGKRIRYKADVEYEEHFRVDFEEAVRRRLRSDSPILAELSGGVDSSSIVCMADAMIARGIAETSRLDTVSYYDDSEPNWNERPYFTKVEEKRGRTGTHIDFARREAFKFEFDSHQFMATPGSGGHATEASRRLMACMTVQGNRVLLSGVGGDEATGGVPTPTPELEDLLASGQFRTLARQLKLWALNKRKPWFHLFLESARGFLPPALVAVPKYEQTAPWLNPGFARRNRAALRGYPASLSLFGSMPSFQENLSTLEMLRRQLACSALPAEPLTEKRYPFLDRSFLEFIYAIPREQLVRPGQRRSLMRRALVGIVPDELLNRKRKAFVSRAPMAFISAEWAGLVELSGHMASSSLGIVDQKSFSETLKKALRGQEIPVATIMRTLGVELWLRQLSKQGIIARVTSTKDDVSPDETARALGNRYGKQFS
jgi:asparagine synthase (glutamine-hydrolysing)